MSETTKSTDKLKKWVIELAISCVIGLVLGLSITHFIACIGNVEGSSMEPTLYDGDKVIINRLVEPEVGDIIVFELEDRSLIKRVIGVPGDKVIIKDSKVYVNGDLIEEPYIKDVEFDSGQYSDTILDEGVYYVMGDNRNDSFDSRYFGTVSEEQIVGVTNK